MLPIINFGQQANGVIPYTISNDDCYIAVNEYGTSVPLEYQSLVFIPDRPVPECGWYERDEKDIIYLHEKKIAPVLVEENRQPYAGKYMCYIIVTCYNKEEVLRKCPQGFIPAIVVIDPLSTYINILKIFN